MVTVINPMQEPYNDAEKKLMSATVDVLNNEEEREGGGDEEEKEMLQQLVLSVVDSYWMTLKEREKMKRLVKILMDNVMCVCIVLLEIMDLLIYTRLLVSV